MDYGDFDSVKAEKMMAMTKFKRKNKTNKFLRYAIVAASAVLLSWISVWVPIIVQTTTLYIGIACTVVASQKFIFFMCNVIILTLAAKSGQLSSGGGSGSPDLYEEFMKNSENRPKYVTNPGLEVEKECVSEDSPPVHEKSTVEEVEEVTKEVVTVEVTSSSRRKFERSQSENIERAHPRSERRLQRSETALVSVETQTEDGENPSRIVVESNTESNDDFKKRIEDFISKQLLRRQREEEDTLRFAVVVQT